MSLEKLEFTVTARISLPSQQVYELVADPEKLSRYFTTGGAVGRLEAGTVVTWDFHDFPGAFPVTVVEAVPPRWIVLEWGAAESAGASGNNRVTFEFEALDAAARTVVTVTESAWRPTTAGAKAAFGNCEGWTGMLLAMKAWAEHGVVLRDGLYA